MRVLHPVTQREHLVASGVYRYTRSGQQLAGSEHFSIHALPDGSWFVRIDYDWRDLDRTSQLIEALYDPASDGGRIQRVAAQLHAPDGIRRETFDFHARAALVGMSSPTGDRQDVEVALREGYVVLLLKTALVGIQVARWPVADDEPVMAFFGYRTHRGEPLILDSRRMQVGTDQVTIAGRTYEAAVFDVDGEFTQRVWATPQGVVLRRQIGEMDIRVANLALGQNGTVA
ncbi:MAG: hypothetical protein IPM16_02570 [Chloroflexi bacterium]|nr:hypothetical protein [Chloroflexota bacterium]